MGQSYFETKDILGESNPNVPTTIGDIKDDILYAQAALGSPVKIHTAGVSIATAQTAVTLTAGMTFLAVYVKELTTITGVAIHTRTAGSFTAANENSITLYSYSGGTLTKVAASANSGTIWQSTANTFSQVPFSGSTYSAAAGVYFVGLCYNNSAQTTAPQLAGGLTISNAAIVSPLTTNSAKLYGTAAGTTSPATILMSSITGTSSIWVGLY
jgi:hypothetical protein